ncbi:DUF1152 domain-containing protein [Pyrobaculum neutrophilum]|uniref:DUF1152 domain-containing protein n=1 Tax=Pyrobaculum neutrophilum (strain DSM 2338 / JCM 9278 / NBRC 100436 / V24Sta) TaxID=444157 RepID=B1YDK0_PYRNV|nr:DUF1152 domain-containing protein [Pyrobaculum neutrophilum]ACB39863.1 protein of unknown function DUF1152 [Pyrobaculum neutrophilum V24Sta]
MTLYLAIGGGGDVVMAAALAGDNPVGQIPWERYVVDPTPGPVPPEALRGVEELGGGLYLATAGSYVERGGRRFKTQGMCAAEVLGKPIYIVDPYRRPSELAKALARFGGVVGVDVGGDVLGIGCEESLGSPLADAYGLAVLAKLAEGGAYAELLVMSPGADGELDRRYIMERAAEVAKMGGLLGVTGISRGQAEVLAGLVERCVTEASAVALKALRGEHGPAPLRGGLRRVEVDICAAVGLRLEPRVLLKLNKAAWTIYERDLPIDKAADVLLEEGIPTELHLERLLAAGYDPRRAVEELRRRKRCLPAARP